MKKPFRWRLPCPSVSAAIVLSALAAVLGPFEAPASAAALGELRSAAAETGDANRWADNPSAASAFTLDPQGLQAAKRAEPFSGAPARSGLSAAGQRALVGLGLGAVGALAGFALAGPIGAVIGALIAMGLGIGLG